MKTPLIAGIPLESIYSRKVMNKNGIGQSAAKHRKMKVQRLSGYAEYTQVSGNGEHLFLNL